MPAYHAQENYKYTAAIYMKDKIDKKVYFYGKINKIENKTPTTTILTLSDTTDTILAYIHDPNVLKYKFGKQQIIRIHRALVCQKDNKCFLQAEINVAGCHFAVWKKDASTPSQIAFLSSRNYSEQPNDKFMIKLLRIMDDEIKIEMNDKEASTSYDTRIMNSFLALPDGWNGDNIDKQEEEIKKFFNFAVTDKITSEISHSLNTQFYGNNGSDAAFQWMSKCKSCHNTIYVHHSSNETPCPKCGKLEEGKSIGLMARIALRSSENLTVALSCPLTSSPIFRKVVGPFSFRTLWEKSKDEFSAWCREKVKCLEEFSKKYEIQKFSGTVVNLVRDFACMEVLVEQIEIIEKS